MCACHSQSQLNMHDGDQAIATPICHSPKKEKKEDECPVSSGWRWCMSHPLPSKPSQCPQDCKSRENLSGMMALLLRPLIFLADSLAPGCTLPSQDQTIIPHSPYNSGLEIEHQWDTWSFLVRGTIRKQLLHCCLRCLLPILESAGTKVYCPAAVVGSQVSALSSMQKALK